MSTGRGRIVAFRNDRLGARLISLVNAMRLAEDHGFDFAMHWHSTPGVGHEFNDPCEIFDESFVAAHFIDREAWLPIMRGARTITPNRVLPHAELAAELGAGRDVRLEAVFGTVILQGEDREAVARRTGEVFRALPLAPALRPLFAQLTEAFGGAVGYHLRRGDISSSLKARNRPWPHKFVPSEYYLAHMDEALHAQRKVVVFSDDAETVAEMRAAFPQMLCAADLIPVAGLTPAQRDYLELCAMSACARLIAPEASAFSSAAAQLGNVPKRDVKSDLSPAACIRAEEALLERLQTRPTSFAAEGDIGQSLHHIRGYLETAGRGREALALHRQYLERGLEISFLFRDAMALALRADQPRAALAIADTVARSQVYHSVDLVACLVFEALAAAATGDPERARRALLRGLWHQGDFGAFKRMGPGLLLGGALDGSNFVPVSPEVIAAMGVALSPQKLEQAALDGVPLAPLLRLMPPDWATRLAPVRRGSLTPVWADWQLLLGSRPLRNWLARAYPEREAAQLAQAAADPDAGPGLKGTLLVLQDHQHPPGKGETPSLLALRQLARTHPDDAMTWQRLCHVSHQRRLPQRAAAAADKALALMDFPAMQALAGMCKMVQARSQPAALEHLQTANAAGLGLPSIPAALARVQRITGDAPAALAATERAIALAPNEGRFRQSRAELLADLGADDDAVAELEALAASQRAAPAGYLLWARIEQRRDRPGAARAALAEGLAQRPDDAQLMAATEALAANAPI